MKKTKILIPVVALGLLLAACNDSETNISKEKDNKNNIEKVTNGESQNYSLEDIQNGNIKLYNIARDISYNEAYNLYAIDTIKPQSIFTIIKVITENSGENLQESTELLDLYKQKLDSEKPTLVEDEYIFYNTAYNLLSDYVTTYNEVYEEYSTTEDNERYNDLNYLITTKLENIQEFLANKENLLNISHTIVGLSNQELDITSARAYADFLYNVDIMDFTDTLIFLQGNVGSNYYAYSNEQGELSQEDSKIVKDTAKEMMNSMLSDYLTLNKDIENKDNVYYKAFEELINYYYSEEFDKALNTYIDTKKEEIPRTDEEKEINPIPVMDSTLLMDAFFNNKYYKNYEEVIVNPFNITKGDKLAYIEYASVIDNLRITNF